MNEDLTLSMRLYADTARFVAGLTEGSHEVEKFSDRAREHLHQLGESWESLEGRLATFGVAVGLLEVARDGAKLDQQYARIGIAAQATTENINKLRESVEDLAVKYGLSKEDLAGGAQSLINSGLNSDETVKSLEAVTKAAVIGGGALTDYTNALVQARTNFHLDLGADGASEHFISKLMFASHGHRIGLANLTSIFGADATVAAQAGLTSEQEMAIIEGLGDAGLDDDRVQIGLRSLLTTFSNPRNKIDAAGAAGIPVIDKNGHLRNMMDMLPDFQRVFAQHHGDLDQNRWIQDVFKESDAKGISAIRALLKDDNVQNISSLADKIGDAGEQMERDLPAALDNANTQAGRLKQTLLLGAEGFASHIMDGINYALKRVNDTMQAHTSPTGGGELLIGGGLLGIFGGVAVKAMLRKEAEEGALHAMKKDFIAKFGSVAGLGEGIALGKALSAVGIQPVFVVNMPSGGPLSSGAPSGPLGDLLKKGAKEGEVEAAAEGGLLATSLKYLRSGWGLARAGGAYMADIGAGTLPELYASGAFVAGTAALALGSSALGGYGIGSGISWGLNQFDAGRDFNNGLGHMIGAAQGYAIADQIAADQARLHRLTKLPFGADGGAPRLSTVVSDYDAAERGDPLASRQAISDALGAALGQSGRNAADVTAPVHQVDLTISFDQAGLPLIRSVKQSKDSKVKVNPAAGILGFGG